MGVLCYACVPLFLVSSPAALAAQLERAFAAPSIRVGPLDRNARCLALFKEVDMNGNGWVDLREWVVARTNRVGRTTEEIEALASSGSLLASNGEEEGEDQVLSGLQACFAFTLVACQLVATLLWPSIGCVRREVHRLCAPSTLPSPDDCRACVTTASRTDRGASGVFVDGSRHVESRSHPARAE